MLLDLDRTDDARTREGTHRGPVRLGVEAAGWLQLVLGALGAL
jgi:predicted phage tail protein